MRKILSCSLLLIVLFLTACQGTNGQSSQESPDSAAIDWSQAGPDAQKEKISFAAVEEAVENGAKFYDVRSPAEFEAGNFGITENVPMADLEAGRLPTVDKDTKIYLHCLKGIRSAQAAEILRQAGFTQVYDLGGIEHVQAIGGVLN